jgi:hypothetical protein
MEWIFFFLLLAVLFFELYPVKVLKVKRCPKKVLNNKTFQRSFVVHLHTMFSYDSLGKPEEVEKIAKELDVEKVFITDHDREDIENLLPKSDILVGGWEYQDEKYGRLLKLAGGRQTVMAHPNNPKKKLYRWRGVFEKDFFYELVDLKDVFTVAPFWLKLYFFLRSAVLYPVRGLKSLNYFPKLIPLQEWVEAYIDRTGGTLKIIGGLDHHVKVSFWEKPKKFFSIPHYKWSFYLLQNKTFDGTDTFKALEKGDFYLSFCNHRLEIFENSVLSGEKILTFCHKRDGSYSVNDCGKVEEETVVVAVYKYLFRLGNVYFGLTPIGVFRKEDF